MANLIPKEEISVWREALPNQIKRTTTDSDIVNLISAITDPEMLEHIRENFITYANVLDSGRYSAEQYLNAVKYVTYKRTGNTNVEAFERTFPQKMLNYTLNNLSRNTIHAYVSAYHKSKLVTQLLIQSTITHDILYQDHFHEALTTQMEIMRDTQVSPKTRSDAAHSVMMILKPVTKTDAVTVNINNTQVNIVDKFADNLDSLANLLGNAISAGELTANEVIDMPLIKDDLV